MTLSLVPPESFFFALGTGVNWWQTRLFGVYGMSLTGAGDTIPVLGFVCWIGYVADSFYALE